MAPAAARGLGEDSGDLPDLLNGFMLDTAMDCSHLDHDENLK